MMQKTWKMTETLANGYSYESTRWELSNGYQHDRVSMVFENICVLVIWMKEASALEGLTSPLNFQILQTISKVKVFFDNYNCDRKSFHHKQKLKISLFPDILSNLWNHWNPWVCFLQVNFISIHVLPNILHHVSQRWNLIRSCLQDPKSPDYFDFQNIFEEEMLIRN